MLPDEPSAAILEYKIDFLLLVDDDDIVQFGYVLMVHLLQNGHLVPNQQVCQSGLRCPFFVLRFGFAHQRRL